jgi:hypothetical protein
VDEPSRPFFEFWRTRAAFIEKLDPHDDFYEANVLTWAALDAVGNLWGRCLHPDSNKPARRTGDFLALHGGDAFRRVSLPALWARADRLDQGSTKRDILERLRQFGGRRKPTFVEQRQFRMLTDDPLADDVLRDLAGVATHVLPKGGTVSDLVLACRFGEIAYTEMRCALLHEGRLGEGAHGFELGAESHDGPTYLSGSFSVPPSIGFFPRYMVKVLRTCIDGFELEAKAAGANPVPSPRGSIVLDLDGEMET